MRYSLDLDAGWLLMGSTGWSEAEYEQMLTGGLGHDFAGIGLTEIRLNDIDLKFTHPVAEFSAGRTSGVVLFDDRGVGHASLNCFQLNGVAVGEPVSIAVRFTPGEPPKPD